ncbi:MAG: hypothetical protein FJY29_01280 [Betaproteobacteria bacterium]|nr:hypothetical protein [Betaproteobacteria bacterium]
MGKAWIALVAGVCVGVGTSCSQLPGAAVPKPESVVSSADSKNADSIQKEDGSSSVEKSSEGEEKPASQPSPAAQPSPQPTAAVAADCSNAAALKSDSLSIIVAKNVPSAGGNKCPFGMADNAPKTNGKYAARLELNRSINIPAERNLCGINPSAATQSIKYDDHMFVNLNGFVLLASRGIPNEFDLDASGFRKYDWSKLVSTERGSNTKCAAGVACVIPATETNGNFSFSLSEDARKKLLTAIADKPLQFSVVLTGDNNEDADCRLENDLTLTFNYTYVAK